VLVASDDFPGALVHMMQPIQPAPEQDRVDGEVGRASFAPIAAVGR
jgi:hypothetical protein